MNEEAVLPALLERTTRVLDELPGGPHELVLVDDGSRDRTWELMQKGAHRDPRIVAISLSRNFGHQAAFSAALEHSSGEAVVLMDGDLQDTPEAIPRMLEKLREGYDVVYAIRVARKEGLLLRTCYRLFYWLISAMADIDLPHGAGDFCVMSRRVVDHLKGAPEHHRYLRGMRTWVGFRQIGVPVERGTRQAGESKYTMRRLAGLAIDGIFSFSIVPLRAAALLGILSVVCSVLVAAYSVFAKVVLDRSPVGFTALIVSISFFAGVQLLFLGVIGEYIGRIYEQIKGRPRFIVDQVVRASEPSSPAADRDPPRR